MTSMMLLLLSSSLCILGITASGTTEADVTSVSSSATAGTTVSIAVSTSAKSTQGTSEVPDTTSARRHRCDVTITTFCASPPSCFDSFICQIIMKREMFQNINIIDR